MSRLSEVVDRPPFAPWEGAHKIPWNEPAFSERMLREHLSQDHDLASRRFSKIDRHTAWIHGELLGGKPGRILDLGCGPGLYATRFAKLGHLVVGIDFSPASIHFARNESEANGLDSTFHLADVRDGLVGENYDLVLMVYGELNVFAPVEARLIVERARGSLRSGGKLLLEVSTEEAVRALGARPPTWRTALSGLFSDSPHLVLHECQWFPVQECAAERWHVVEAESCEVRQYSSTTKAYSLDGYRSLLANNFEEVKVVPGPNGNGDPDFQWIIATASI